MRVRSRVIGIITGRGDTPGEELATGERAAGADLAAKPRGVPGSESLSPARIACFLVALMADGLATGFPEVAR